MSGLWRLAVDETILALFTIAAQRKGASRIG